MTTLLVLVGFVVLFVGYGLFAGQAQKSRDCQKCGGADDDPGEVLCPLLADPAPEFGRCDRTDEHESTARLSNGVPLPVLRVPLKQGEDRIPVPRR